MAITIFVLVIGRNGLAPRSTTLELNMLYVDTGVDDIDVNTITTLIIVLVLVECGEAEPGTVANSGETLRLPSVKLCHLTETSKTEHTQGAPV